MEPHLLVSQLHFARSEFVRGLEGVSAEDAVRRQMLGHRNLPDFVGEINMAPYRREE